MELTIDQRIENGVRYLNQHMPDWLDIIDLDRLDLAADCSCVLGQIVGKVDGESMFTNVVEQPPQVRGHWHQNKRVAEEAGMPEIMSFQQSVDNGFHTGDFDSPSDEWAALTQAWGRKITELRNKEG